MVYYNFNNTWNHRSRCCEVSLSRALFIGRFQPFHYGHLKALKYILNKTGQVIIVIGSAQYSHTLENPFTAGERIMMISAALKESDVQKDSYYLVPLEDLNVHDIWVSYVRSRVPDFDVVFSNEALTSSLFKEAGIMIERIPFFRTTGRSDVACLRRRKARWIRFVLLQLRFIGGQARFVVG